MKILKRARRPHSKLTVASRQKAIADTEAQIANLDQEIIQLGQDYADVIYNIGEILDQANQAAAANTPQGQSAPTSPTTWRRGSCT